MARENPDAVDESWLQDTIVPSSPPEAAVKTTATPPAPRKAAPPPRRIDRDAELAERSEEVQRMLRGVTNQLNAIQGEAAKSAAKLADSAVGALAQVGGKLVQILAAPFLILLKIVMFPLMLVQRLLGRLSPAAAAAADDEEELPDWDHETTKDDPPPEQLSNFSEMLELNIVFMDNQRTPLYTMAQTRGTGRLGRVEEQFIMDNSLQAIRECAEFTAELPTPTTGPYANEPIRTIMEGVQPVDVGRFLAFVKAFPGKYIGKSWKISETFATWLLNNAPGPQG